MATKFFCDRCDFITSDTDKICSVDIPVYNQYKHDLEGLPKKSYDLCANCIRALNEFMKPFPKETKS